MRLIERNDEPTRLWWTSDDPPSERVTLWRGSNATGVHEWEYVRADTAAGAVARVAELEQTISELHESVDIERERADGYKAKLDALGGR